MLSLPSSIFPNLNKRNLIDDRERLLKAWERFMSGESKKDLEVIAAENQLIRSFIVESWERSKQFSLNPLAPGSSKNYSSFDLKQLCANDPILPIAEPVISQLNRELFGSEYVLFLSNKDGVILHVSGSKSMIGRVGNESNAVPGAVWSEQWAGTNAIGTSLALKRPIQLFSAEHFTLGCHEWVCNAVPILDPFTGEVISVLDITTEYKDINETSLTLAMWGAASIEKLISMEYFRAKEMIHRIFADAASKWKDSLIYLIDLNGNLIVANNFALKHNIDKSIFQTKMFTQSVDQNEWEMELVIQDCIYQAYVRNIFWRQKNIAKLVVLNPKKSKTVIERGNKAKYSFSNIIGEDPAFRQVIKLAKKAASSDANILITGESGTGKELLASAIHQLSKRGNKPFIAVNCGAFPKELIASELFGYAPGAFTGADPKGKKGKFELANEGTLFLDEIGETTLDFQVQLLRAIQEQEITPVGGNEKKNIDVRIIAATNRDLDEEMNKGTFRNDLYYRIKVFEIKLPPLRERKKDIPLLCNYFIEKHSAKCGKGPFYMSDDALRILEEYDWPGNIRELENAIIFAVHVSDCVMIKPEDLPEEIISAVQSGKQGLTPVEQSELNWILEVLERTNMNFTKAAKELGMNRSTIYRKLKKYGYDIKRKKFITV